MAKKQTVASDEQLFERHRRARANKKKKMIVTISGILVAVLLVVTIGVGLLKETINEQVGAGAGSEVLSAEVNVGSISATVSGSGTLAAEDVETLEIPSSLEIVDYYVEIGDKVEAGELIATVTNASIQKALANAQEQLDAMDKKIAAASGAEASTSVIASVDGRVKAVYVEKGDDVLAKMYDQGALILLSLDGYMAVDITNSSAKAGDIVYVTRNNSKVVEGVVEKQINGVATVLVSDKNGSLGEGVTVRDADGNKLGLGKLRINNQMIITGYVGTVSAVKVSVDEMVSAGDTLLTLKDTATSASYDALLKERKELEENLNDLIKIYKEGGICTSIVGVVDSLSTSKVTISPNTTMAITINVDETNILSLSVGQEATVSIDSIGSDKYTGVVEEVSTTATSSSGVTYYSATITIDKTEKMLSGMTASVVITIEGSDNALLIPADALHQTSSTAYVYTEYDEETGEFSGMKEVVTGLSNSTYVEIKEGLEEGETVYYTEKEENSFGSGSFPGGAGFPGGSGSGGFPGGSGSDGFPGGSSGFPSFGN